VPWARGPELPIVAFSSAGRRTRSIASPQWPSCSTASTLESLRLFPIPPSGTQTGEWDIPRPGIAPTDAETDNLVYEIYGITDEERRIIEGS